MLPASRTYHAGKDSCQGRVVLQPCPVRLSRAGSVRAGRASGQRHRVAFQPVAALPFFRKPSESKSDAAFTNGHSQQQQQQAHQQLHFDLPLAVVLAGAAFEAYLQPQGGRGFKQRSVGGPTVTYIDTPFLTQTYSGVLVVSLVGASNLRPADLNGRSDPYAILSLANCSFRSATIPGTLEPAWNETHAMYIRDPATDVLRIRLFDADLGKSDDELGLAMLSLGSLAGSKGAEQTFTLPLRGPGAGSGATVTLRLKLLAFADADPEEVAALTTTATTAPSPPALAGLQAAAAAVAAVPQQLEAALGSVRPPQQGAGREGQDGATGPSASASSSASISSASSSASASAPPAGSTVELPGGETVANPWRLLARMAARGAEAEALSPVAFVENEETDTQVWLYRNKQLREAVIAFRGTEQIKWKDIATDLNLTPASLNPERLDDNAGLPFTARIIRAVAGATQNQLMVHKGFLDAYDSVKRTVFTLLDAITGSGSGEPGSSTSGSGSGSGSGLFGSGLLGSGSGSGSGPWRVYVTGHSLGGALATLAAYELAERRTAARAVQSITLYTYGAPRVGNKAFAEAFDRAVPDAWRVTNTNDIIPSVPRLMGYCHIGHAVRLGADGGLRVGRSAAESTDVFGEGKAGVEVIQDIVSRVSEQSRPWDEIYGEIKEREMALLDALVGGKGLEEHMETFYLASLQQAVEASKAAKAEQ